MNKELLGNIRKTISEEKLDAVLLTDIYKILHLLGINASFNFIEIGFYLLITKKEIHLIGDPFSFSQVKVGKEIKKELESLPKFRENAMRPIKRLKDILKKLKIKRIGSFEDIDLPDYEIVSIEDPFLKSFLYPDENRLAILKENSSICNKVLKGTLERIKEGCSEISIRNTIDESIYEFGGERRAFPTKVIFGKNTANPFAISNNTKLKDGDPLFINFGLIRSGVGIEVARTYTIGTPEKEFKELYRKTSTIYRKFLEFLTPGKIIKEVYNYVCELIKENGYTENFIEPLGIPLSPIKNGVIISPNNTSILKPGVILSLQLGLYFPGKYGIRFQDVVILQEKAIILTNYLSKRSYDISTHQV